MEKRHPNTKCGICSKEIYRRPSELKNNGNVYCSQNCYGLAIRKEKPCVVCGKLIMATFNKATCSKACQIVNDNRPDRRHSLGRQKKIQTSYGTRSFRKYFLEKTTIKNTKKFKQDNSSKAL